MQTIGFVGAGNMACALGGGISGQSDGQVQVCATDPIAEAGERFCAETGGTFHANLAELMAKADVLVLAVKPQVLPDILSEVRGLVTSAPLVVSIAAGISLATLTEGLGREARVIRAMPNTPALVRRGVTVLVRGGAATAEDLALVERLFGSVGRVLTTAKESELDAVTAISGSGPGFLFAYAEAMVAAGVAA